MIDYRRLGAVSPKPHTIFEVDGKMVAEHVFTRDGFSDLYSILYQRRAPTHETKAELWKNPNPHFPHVADSSTALGELLRRHVKTPSLPAGGTLLSSRVTLFFNADCTVGIAKPDRTDDVFFVNGDADELYFVAEGGGTLQSMFGELDYSAGDYVYIPKGTPYRFLLKGPQNFFVVEGMKDFGIPAEFRHPKGQLRLDAPYGHRDFRSPSRLTDFKPGENFDIIVKRFDTLSRRSYTDWPYQVVGWDGWVYPFAFAVSDYQPKTSSVHLPPSIHCVFGAKGFVMMNFVPRIVDYAKNAIPCPYPHSSVDCDEILFYVDGNFTSRKSIGQYSISFHPGGIPHGPHPEKYEQSIGARETNELAVMVDTFAPLHMTAAALSFEDQSYHFTWDTSEHL
ncbi:MAG: homogentisate 1,2-dioxygenase [Silvanigrellales bacterium]|nr:homogentisate 1,2-dioxygenase [Silvanigrellales bacterium]